MNTNKLFLAAALSAVVVVSCQKDPQKEAQKEADKQERMAERQSEQADKDLNNGADHVANAVMHQSAAELNQAIANVSVPKFDNLESNEFVKKVGNDIRKLVNSESYQQTGKYVDVLNADTAELQQKVTKGSINTADAEVIKKYATDLANAVGVTFN